MEESLTIIVSRDLEAFKDYFWFFNMKITKAIPRRILTFALLIVGFVLLCASTQDRYFALLAIFSFVGLVVTVIRLQQTPARLLRKTGLVWGATITYTFNEGWLAVCSQGAELNSNQTVLYSAFVKAYETDKAFYLQLKSTQCFIIAKKFLAAEQVLWLQGFLQRKFGMQYKQSR